MFGVVTPPTAGSAQLNFYLVHLPSNNCQAVNNNVIKMFN